MSNLEEMYLNFEDDVTPLDRELATRAMEALHTHYPNWHWVVEVPPGQNILVVKNYDLDERGKTGMVCHKDKLSGDPNLHYIVMAAGELLERWRMKVGAYSEEQIKDRMMIFEKPQH